jgi:hypothetical protein
VQKSKPEIFYEASQDRKREAYNYLRVWDEQRAQFLNFHRNLIEQIQGGVDHQVNCSQDLMNLLIRFFSDRIAQEMNYTRTPLPRLKKICSDFKQMNIGDKRHLSFIEELENSQIHRSQASAKLAQTIDKEIIHNILIREIKEYEEKVGFLREAMIQSKKKLAILNVNTSRKSSKFSTLFVSMANTPFGGKRPTKDLFCKEMAFLLLAKEQSDVQRDLARQTLCFWETVLDLERIRRKALDQAFKIYNEAYLECYKSNPHIENGATFLQEEEGTLSSVLGFDKILKPEDLEKIATMVPGFSLEKITFSELEKFFTSFQFSRLDEKALVLKEMKAQREITTWPIASQSQTNPINAPRAQLDNGEVMKECRVHFTVDGFLAVSEPPVKEGDIRKPLVYIALSKAAYRVRQDHKSIELQRSIPGFLVSSTEKFLFKFETKDELEEFIEFANRLRI